MLPTSGLFGRTLKTLRLAPEMKHRQTSDVFSGDISRIGSKLLASTQSSLPTLRSSKLASTTPPTHRPRLRPNPHSAPQWVSPHTNFFRLEIQSSQDLAGSSLFSP